MNETLSLVIPTFNRADYLAKTLDAFLPQIMPRQIPIYISYNDSTDRTEKLLSEFKKLYSLIFYCTDPAITGIDKNIDVAVRMAKSKYVWLFGDDDLPMGDAIDSLWPHLQEDYGMILVNAASYNLDLSRCIEGKRMRIDRDRVYEPGQQDRLLTDTASYATFIGGVVIQRELWNRVPKDEFMGSYYAHVAVTYRAVVGKRALAIAKPLLKIRLGGATWADRYFEIELIKWPGIVWGLPSESYSDRVKASVCAMKPTSSIGRILATRAYGYYGQEQFSRFIETDPQIPWWKKTILRFVAHFPIRCVRIVFIAYRYLQRIRGDANFDLTMYRLETSPR